METPDSPARRSTRSRSVWTPILQFSAALIILGFLAAGPGLLDAFGRIPDLTRRSRAVPDPASIPARSPAARAEAPARQAPSPSAPAASVPASPATAAPAKVAPPRRAGVAAEQAARPRAAAAPAPQARSRPAPAATPSPSVAESTAPPQRYFDKLMREGHQLYSTGWYGPAMGRFRQAATVVPTSASAHLWIGRAALKAGRQGEARQALERAIELAPASEAAREARWLLERLN